LVHGILVLLDALGTKLTEKEDLKERIRNFDLVDDRLNNDINILRADLERHHYSHLISSGTIYDNFQIFLPIDIDNTPYVDMTGKNDWYWSLVSIGNLLIDVFRHALSHRIPLEAVLPLVMGKKVKQIDC
jgi:hypothetical protein